MKQLIAASCLLLGACLVSACGWHLRGSIGADLAIDSVYVKADNQHGELASELRRALAANKVSVSQDAGSAQYQISLSKERRDRRVVSVGNEALASEYELTLSVNYLLTDRAGMVLAPTSEALALRSYNFDRNAVVAIAEEEKLIERELRANLIQQIIRRLQFVSQAAAAVGEDGQAAP